MKKSRVIALGVLLLSLAALWVGVRPRFGGSSVREERPREVSVKPTPIAAVTATATPVATDAATSSTLIVVGERATRDRDPSPPPHRALRKGERFVYGNVYLEGQKMGPAAGAKVRFAPPPEYPFAPAPPAVAELTCDANGRFEAILPPQAAHALKCAGTASFEGYLSVSKLLEEAASGDSKAPTESYMFFSLPEVAGVVSGVVIDPDGKPVAGAQVGLETRAGEWNLWSNNVRYSLSPEKGHPFAKCPRATSDQNGEFKIELDSGKMWAGALQRAAAVAPGYVPVVEKIDSESIPARLVLKLGRGEARIEGTVFGGDDKPVVGAFVTFVYEGPLRNSKERTYPDKDENLLIQLGQNTAAKTDAEGRYAFAVRSGEYELRAVVQTPESLSQQVKTSVEVGGRKTVDFRFPAPAELVVECISRESRLPLQGVIVERPDPLPPLISETVIGVDGMPTTQWRVGPRGATVRAVSDAQGIARLGDVHSGNAKGVTVVVRATGPGGVVPEHSIDGAVHLPDITPEDAKRKLVFVAATELRVEVVDADEEPVTEGVNLRMSTHDDPYSTIGFTNTRPSEEGRATFKIGAPTSIMVIAEPTGAEYNDDSRELVRLQPSSEGEDIKLVIGARGVITGMVHFPGGGPAAFVAVHARLSAPWGREGQYGVGGMTKRTESDSAGGYRFEKLVPGKWEISVGSHLPGLGGKVVNLMVPGPEKIDLALNEERTDLDFEVSYGGVIHGFVRDEEGNGIAGAYVSASGESPLKGSFSEHGTSDQSGEYYVTGLPEGARIDGVGASHLDFASSHIRNPEPGRVEFDFVLQPKGWVMLTAVDEATGGLIADFKLDIRGQAHGAGAYSGGHAATNAAIRIDGMSAGEAEFIVTEVDAERNPTGRYGSTTRRFDAQPAGEEIVVNVVGKRRLTGTVTALPGGEPLAGARLIFENRKPFHETTQEKRSEADGSFEFEFESPDKYSLKVIGPDGYGRRNLWGPAPGSEDPAPLVIALPPGEELRGLVLDTARRPIKGALVTALARELDPQGVATGDSTWGGDATTDADGRWEFESASYGHYRLSARYKGMSLSKSTEHRPGSVSEVEFIFAEPVKVSAKVTVNGGAPIGYINFSIWKEGVNESTSGHTENGAAQFEIVMPEGTYKTMFDWMGLHFHQPSDLVLDPASPPAPIELDIPAGRVVFHIPAPALAGQKGSLRFTPVPEDPHRRIYGQSTEPSGDFEMPQFPLGRWRAELTRWDGTEDIVRPAEFEVTAGGLTEVTFEAVGGNQN